MQILTHTFVVLQYIGLWRPVHWPRGWRRTLYDCYTWLMLFLLISVTLFELIELLGSLDDVASFANNSFMLLTMIGVCGKAANILIKRREIVELTDTLGRDPCRARNEDELTIQHKFDNVIRFNTLSYATLVGLTVFLISLASIINDVPRRDLPYEAWLPFDHEESLVGYSMAYNHQIVTLVAGAAVHVAFDSLVSGLMLQTCAQLNILKHRFHAMPHIILDQAGDVRHENESSLLIPMLESKLLSQRVAHHTEIFKFAKITNDLFGVMIFVQCAISTVVLCVSVLELSTMKPFTPEFTSVIMYLTCMLMQILIFCLYGYEVTIESVKLGDAVYEMDWSSLSRKTQTSLLTIMVRTLRPIRMTSFHLLTLNLDLFNGLLKLSYSTYNLLRRTFAKITSFACLLSCKSRQFIEDAIQA